MLYSWRLYIDESGTPETEVPGDVSVVAGVLMRKLSSEQWLRRSFESLAPYWPWPHHAMLTRHGALHALAARCRPIATPTSMLPGEYEECISAGTRLAAGMTDPEPAADLRAFDGDITRGRVPRSEASHRLVEASVRVNRPLKRALDRELAGQYESWFAQSLDDAAASQGQPIALAVAASLGVAPDPSTCYLSLLESLCSAVAAALDAVGDQHEIWLHVSERNIPDGRATRRVDALDLASTFAQPSVRSGRVRWAGLLTERYLDRNLAAGYVAADFAARKARVALLDNPPHLRHLLNTLQLETGLSATLGCVPMPLLAVASCTFPVRPSWATQLDALWNGA